ncbi:MAG: acetate--CoA ligase family protein [Candidatus Aenigmarchaeota archaeon]|nr:acetate--CoA ligase family protein [Candidatus Aenigmarchaeota archaeon]
MRLYEFESKDILRQYGIEIPKSLLLRSPEDLDGDAAGKKVVKAQLLTVGSREKFGAVKICSSIEEVRKSANTLLHSTVCNEPVDSILLEEKIEALNEYYVGMAYDTDSKTPVVVLSKSGGVDVEKSRNVVKKEIDPVLGIQDWLAREIAKEAGFSSNIVKVADIIKKLYACFVKEDAKIVEINPLAETSDGRFVALDALIELDDDAGFRHKERSLQPRTLANRKPTERELAVKKINESDYRGTVKYMELDGDIAFLAAGGGGSITCMDALINCGGSASNYTEYSGNPPKEKVYELTKQMLSRPGLNGLWIVGAIANFTRVDETMQGIVDAIIEVKPRYPIVVRRSGPYEKEGLDILRTAAKAHGLDMTVYGKEMPMTKTARILMDKVSVYKKKVSA